MVHVSTLSGGGSSWLSARIVQRERVRPGDQHLLVFTDTLYEDADAYRFLVEGALNVFGRSVGWLPVADDFPDYRASDEVAIETYAGNSAWREYLRQLRERAAEAVPELIWLVEGRDPWEVYRDGRYLGNSRRDPCSRVLKREILDAWCGANCDPAATVIYFGIGDAESHRFDDGGGHGIRPRWASAGWQTDAPLIGRIEGNLNAAVYMAQQGIVTPRLYGLGYAHNNCGGKCSKAGMSHWALRHRVQPDRYAYDAMMEGKIAAFLGSNVAFMTDRRGARRVPLTLAEFGRRLDANPAAQLPPPEPGESGCGCMTEAA